VFDANRRELQKLRDKYQNLEHEYRRSDYHDMVSLSFLEGSDVSEHTQTEIYRISPADGIQRQSVEKKLCGYRVQAFGAFLKREWRENDILWGRLDTCERIVSAVLRPMDRDDFVKQLRAAIVRQEARNSKLDLAGALRAIERDDLQGYLASEDGYTLPDWPESKQSARQMADAADILGRMVEEDVGTKNRATGLVRTGGRLAAQLVGLLTPGGLGRVFWDYWLALFGVAAGLLWVFGSIVRDEHTRTLGAYGVGAAILAWFLSLFVGSLLAGFKVPGFVINVVKVFAAIGFLMLLGIGLLHVPRDAQDLWRWLGGPAFLSWVNATLLPVLRVFGFALAMTVMLVLIVIGLRHLPQDASNLWRRFCRARGTRLVRS
jgi:hypothetical protein